MRRKKKGRRGGRKKKRKQPWLRYDPSFVPAYSEILVSINFQPQKISFNLS
jgi:hypothetical protein